MKKNICLFLLLLFVVFSFGCLGVKNEKDLKNDDTIILKSDERVINVFEYHGMPYILIEIDSNTKPRILCVRDFDGKYHKKIIEK